MRKTQVKEGPGTKTGEESKNGKLEEREGVVENKKGGKA